METNSEDAIHKLRMKLNEAVCITVNFSALSLVTLNIYFVNSRQLINTTLVALSTMTTSSAIQLKCSGTMTTF